MIKNQVVGCKSLWRDEFLKWICSFANSNGGKLLLGVDDKGHVIGLKKGKI